MATQDRSSSLCLGQSWASWADEMCIVDEQDDEEEEDKSDAKDDGDCMKLNKKDMQLFGFCPFRDEFMLVKCETCGMLLKPQALRHHIESRHKAALAPSPEQTVSSKALNSELAKTLSLPVTNFGKTTTTNKLPTKASLKQVPSSVRMLTSSTKSRESESASCQVNSSPHVFRKGNTNPVVKMERIPKEVATLKKMTTTTTSASSSPASDVKSNSPSPVAITPALGASGTMPVGSADGGKTVSNGAMLKQALSTSLSSVTLLSTTAVTTLASQMLAVTTTTSSITHSRPIPTASVPVTTTSMTVLSKSSKSLPSAMLGSALAATLTATSTPTKSTTHSHTPSSSSKSKKSPKEKKFLLCKDREFDPNKHCGVATDDSSKPCTRSLTCKTHALGLRRAVAGRKKSFDDLLKEHKAAKEALQKAKAGVQAAANGRPATPGHSSVAACPTLVTSVTSPAALAAVSAFKLGPSEAAVSRDVKSAAQALSVSRSSKSPRGAHNAVFQKLTPGSTLLASMTVKEESSPVGDVNSRLSQSSENRLSQSSESRLSQSSENRLSQSSESHLSQSSESRLSQTSESLSSLSSEGRLSQSLESNLSQSIDKDRESREENLDIPCINHHPRPAVGGVFGALSSLRGCGLYSRKNDLVRAALFSALEKPLNPPPHKKLCVESRLPKDPQMSVSSKDPYEFTMVDTGLAHQRPTVSFTIGGPVNSGSGMLGKPLLKHKSKSLPTRSLSVTGLTASSSSVASTPNTIAIPTLAAALLKPTKVANSASVGTAGALSALPRGAASLSQPLSGQAVKRKRGSSQVSGVVSAPAPGTFQLQSGLGLAVGSLASVDGARASKQQHQQQSAVLSAGSTSMNSQSATTPLTAYTFPSINLANAATLGLSAALPTSKQTTGQKASMVKDFSLVLTGIDPSMVTNGQYLNITGTQLAELAAVQAVNATAEDKNIKRSRLAATAKQHAASKFSGTLETLRALQGSSVLTTVPPNAVLVDGSTLQGVVLAPMSSLGGSAGGVGGNGGVGSSTLVTLTSNAVPVTANSNQSLSSITVTPNTIFRTVSESGTPQQVTFSTASYTNGIIPSAGGEKGQWSSGSSSHSQQLHNHQQRLTSCLQTQSSAGTKGTSLQASGLLQVSQAGTTLCPTQGLTQLAHFKQGTLNISKSGKITMQPLSVTFPVVSTMGLGALSTTNNPHTHSQQPNPHTHTQSAMLVSSTTEDGRVGSVGGGVGKTEIHIQPHMAGTSSRVLS